MGGPRFTILARIDDVRFITACPHGVAHLTWERLTLRLALDEFRELADLLAEAPAGRPRMVFIGDLSLAYRPAGPGDPGEVQVGAAVLRLAAAELAQLVDAVQEARRRLDEIVASGAWEEPEAPGPAARADPFRELKRNPFSVN